MIPTIEDIVKGLIAGTYTEYQGIEWLHEHANAGYGELRDSFAMSALEGMLSHSRIVDEAKADDVARWAYDQADAMMKARKP